MVTWKNPCYLNLPLWLFMCNSIILLYIITAEMIINSAHNDNHNAIRNSYQTTRTGNNTIFLILFLFVSPMSCCTWLISPTVVKPRMSLLVACTKLRCTRVKIIWLFNSLSPDAACPAEAPGGAARGARGCPRVPGAPGLGSSLPRCRA